MKKMLVVLLGVLIIGVTVTFTVIILNIVNSNENEAVNSIETIKTETKMAKIKVSDIPDIDREDGLSDMEFWTLYNYWNEKDGYGLPKVDTEDERVMKKIGDKKVYMGSGVYLGYFTRIQFDDEKYGPVWVIGEVLEDYDPKVLADVLRLAIKITEGEDSFMYRNIAQLSKEMIKGITISGENHKWQSKITPYEFTFTGFPYMNKKTEVNDENVDTDSKKSGTEYDSGIENNEDFNLDVYTPNPIEKEKEIFVTQGGIKIKEFYTQEEAIAFAEKLEDAEVFNSNAPIWDNKPSSVFQGEILLGKFKSKQEAINLRKPN